MCLSESADEFVPLRYDFSVNPDEPVTVPNDAVSHGSDRIIGCLRPRQLRDCLIPMTHGVIAISQRLITLVDQLRPLFIHVDRATRLPPRSGPTEHDSGCYVPESAPVLIIPPASVPRKGR